MRRALLGSLLVCIAAASGLEAAEQMPPFPNFTFHRLEDDSPLTVNSLRGKPVLITFWASWCGPCRLELPELQKLNEELNGRGFVLVTVNVDSSVSAARRFLELTRLKIPVYRMDQRDLMELGIASIPTSVLLGPDGRPAQLYEGYSAGVAGALRQLILGMLGPKKGS